MNTWFRQLAPIALLLASHASAELIKQGVPLPTLEIGSLGEVVLEEDKFSYRPWSSDAPVPRAHVLQYIPGTMTASKVYEPFTDLLQERYELGTYHVTTVVNLDAALWGTRGFVVSEVEKNKRKFPLSTLVLDDSGDGVVTWQLDDSGSGLVIVDANAQVHYYHSGKMTAEEMARAESIFSGLMGR